MVVRLFYHRLLTGNKVIAMFHRQLSHLRLDPSALEVSEARFKRFLKELEVYERRFVFERTLDAFLDLYSEWKRHHVNDLKLRLVMLAFELHRLNHEFVCDLSFRDEAPCEKSASGT